MRCNCLSVQQPFNRSQSLPSANAQSLIKILKLSYQNRNVFLLHEKNQQQTKEITAQSMGAMERMTFVHLPAHVLLGVSHYLITSILLVLYKQPPQVYYHDFPSDLTHFIV